MATGCWPLRGVVRWLDLQGRVEWICRGHVELGCAVLHNKDAGSLFRGRGRELACNDPGQVDGSQVGCAEEARPLR